MYSVAILWWSTVSITADASASDTAMPCAASTVAASRASIGLSATTANPWNTIGAPRTIRSSIFCITTTAPCVAMMLKCVGERNLPFTFALSFFLPVVLGGVVGGDLRGKGSACGEECFPQ
jgi:hypothetical protein